MGSEAGTFVSDDEANVVAGRIAGELRIGQGLPDGFGDGDEVRVLRDPRLVHDLRLREPARDLAGVLAKVGHRILEPRAAAEPRTVAPDGAPARAEPRPERLRPAPVRAHGAEPRDADAPRAHREPFRPPASREMPSASSARAITEPSISALASNRPLVLVILIARTE